MLKRSQYYYFIFYTIILLNLQNIRKNMSMRYVARIVYIRVALISQLLKYVRPTLPMDSPMVKTM